MLINITTHHTDHREHLIQKFMVENTYKSNVYGKCVECLYDPEDIGTWRMQIEACTSHGCPLFSKRPTTIKGGIQDEFLH